MLMIPRVLVPGVLIPRVLIPRIMLIPRVFGWRRMMAVFGVTARRRKGWWRRRRRLCGSSSMMRTVVPPDVGLWSTFHSLSDLRSRRPIRL